MSGEDSVLAYMPDLPRSVAEPMDQIIALITPGIPKLNAMAAYIREHHADAAAETDAWETPEGFQHHGLPGWLFHVSQHHPAAFNAALADQEKEAAS